MKRNEISTIGTAQAVPIEAKELGNVRPWKKCSFYTIRQEARYIDSEWKKIGPKADRVSGYTDGYFYYYKAHKIWYAIHPIYGLMVDLGHTRKEAQANALKMLDKLSQLRNDNWWLERCAEYEEMVRDAIEAESKHKE